MNEAAAPYAISDPIFWAAIVRVDGVRVLVATNGQNIVEARPIESRPVFEIQKRPAKF